MIDGNSHAELCIHVQFDVERAKCETWNRENPSCTHIHQVDVSSVSPGLPLVLVAPLLNTACCHDTQGIHHRAAPMTPFRTAAQRV